MRIRLVATIAAALLFLPVASASASLSSSPQPPKCPSLNFILNHCG